MRRENALIYAYEGEQVTGMHATGLVLDLGLLKVSDYKTIKLLFQADVGGAGCGTNVICDSTEVASLYGGAHIVDLKALAEGKKLTSFSKLELSASSWGKLTSHKIYVGFIELELADGIEEDVEAPAEPEVPEIPDVPEEPEIPDVPAQPTNIVYSVDNGNMLSIASALGGGEISNKNYTFVSEAEGISESHNSFSYQYSGEAVKGLHGMGVKFDLGEIDLSKVASIKVVFQQVAKASCGTNIFCGDVEVTPSSGLYGGAHLIDVKALAVAKGLTTISTLELSASSWASITEYSLCIAYIEIEFIA